MPFLVDGSGLFAFAAGHHVPGMNHSSASLATWSGRSMCMKCPAPGRISTREPAARPLRASASVGEVRAYLLATARTVLAAHWRGTLGRPITALGDDRIEDVPAEAPSNAVAAGRAQRILAALPERYRRILELRFLQASPIKEAAAEMGISVANAKVLQYRALRQAAAADERLAP